MKIISICPNSYASNCYALISGKEAFVVDPSVSVESICKAVATEGADIVGVAAGLHHLARDADLL